MKRLFLTLLMLLVFAPDALASSGLSYRIAEDDTVAVTACACEDAEVVIPSVFRGRAVSAIDAYAFKDNAYLERVTIPDSVTGIGESAFNSCVNLREVVFDGWEDAQIGEYAFYNCPLLDRDTPGSSDLSVEGGESFRAAPGEGTVFTVTVSGYCADDNSVGKDWYFLAAVNGTDISEQNRFALCEGDEITIDFTAVEDEKQPDYGYGRVTHTVTQSDLADGFSETVTVTVEEDAGRYRGNRCNADVTVTFRPEG